MSSNNTSSTKASVVSWCPTRSERAPRKNFQLENSQDVNGISVCIRFAFKNITPQRVFACLKKANIEVDGLKTMVFLGLIERIDQVDRKDGNKLFFVHFSPGSWGNTEAADLALEQLCAGELRVYYDEPYFWKLSISKSRRPRVEERRRKLAAPPLGPIPPASDLDENFSSAAALATGNELSYEDGGSIALEIRDEIMSHSNTDGEAVEMDDVFA